jgi:hypothetical protein
MKKFMLVVALVFSFVGIFPAPAAPPPGAPTDKDPAAYKGLSAQDIERMKKGEIVIVKDIGFADADASGMIQAAMILNAPIDKIFALQAQDWRQAEYVPYLDEMFPVQKFPDGTLSEEHIKILFVTINIRVRWYHHPDKYSFNWTLDPSFKNDLKRLDGFWKFYYMDDAHTLARYGTVTQVGFGVPKFAQDFLTRRDLPTALNNNKLWYESNGAWRKPGYKPAPPKK